ncbi:amino acid permease [Paraburkholderia phenoliruptrix]|uniref:amino acid permease n=1 Tax=Paraburkholderia phenoliruptrix TaxID=252970 RepID=UPI00285D5F4D|nr:amino acid permease [Paraburkholderia phenoliruptrix]MDR6391807.1 L-asparagine transporter-like permease [Paraburkholderia phenoliruptrix]
MNDVNGFKAIADREGGLKRSLTRAQLGMIAIGSAIGTGLFLGSGAAIQLAGPSVILSFAIGAFIALLLMGCLAEMVVTHPSTGSFGSYAEHYLGGLAGFVVRYAYWISVVLVIGAEVTAISVYMHFWFPTSPGWLWILVFSAILIAINARSVGSFGAAEYWFSIVKVAAIVGFIVLGSYAVFSAPSDSSIGTRNFYIDGGFFPRGFSGTWNAVVVAVFSFIGIEFIAVAAGEASEPERAARSAFKSALVRLVIFYLLTVALMVAIMPWQSAGTGESPFVMVMKKIGVTGGPSVMNFVILTAALSAMNAQLYVATRMIFSLSRSGYAPAFVSKVSINGVPVRALMLSSFGVAFAAVTSIVMPGGSFILVMSIAMFGALFGWLMIFATHLRFRMACKRDGITPAFRLPLFPVPTILGFFLMIAIIGSTFLVPAFRMSVVTGVPMLVVLALAYALLKVRKCKRAPRLSDAPQALERAKGI